MKRVFVLFVVGVVLFGTFSAQNANAQSANIARNIIGTWVDQSGTCTLVFNANGNLTISGMGAFGTQLGIRDGQYKFIITDTHLAFSIDDSRNDATRVWSISISSDGRTLIISVTFGTGLWLTKR